jgi:hypothetical protein
MADELSCTLGSDQASTAYHACYQQNLPSGYRTHHQYHELWSLPGTERRHQLYRPDEQGWGSMVTLWTEQTRQYPPCKDLEQGVRTGFTSCEEWRRGDMDSITSPRPREKVRSEKPCHDEVRSLSKINYVVSLPVEPAIISPLWKRCFCYCGNTSAATRALTRRSMPWRTRTLSGKRAESTYSET